MLGKRGGSIFRSDLQRALSSVKIGIFRITQNPPPAMACRFDSGYRHHVGASSVRLRNGSRFWRLLFLRLYSAAPPLPHASRCAGLARGPHFPALTVGIFFAQFFQTRQVRTQGQSVKASGLSGFYPIAHASKVRGGLPGFHSALSSKCKHAKNDISCATFHALQLFSG